VIVIDKGIPIPVVNHGAARKYPWCEMEVGDSFFIADCDLGARNGHAANKASKRYAPKVFTSRKVPGGRRTWRVE